MVNQAQHQHKHRIILGPYAFDTGKPLCVHAVLSRPGVSKSAADEHGTEASLASVEKGISQARCCSAGDEPSLLAHYKATARGLPSPSPLVLRPESRASRLAPTPSRPWATHAAATSAPAAFGLLVPGTPRSGEQIFLSLRECRTSEQRGWQAQPLLRSALLRSPPLSLCLRSLRSRRLLPSHRKVLQKPWLLTTRLEPRHKRPVLL